MNTIAVISFLAVLAGIGGIFPQIVAMFQARSSAGQSAFGWCLGVLVNGLLGYVNLVGSRSAVLAAGNAAGLILCVTALALVLVYRSRHARREHPAVAVSALLHSPPAALAELPTTELEALQGAVLDARNVRRQYRQPLESAA